MNVLTIDIGNSRIKLDIWSDTGHILHDDAGSVSFETIDSLIVQNNITGASVCSVGADDTQIYSHLSEKLEGQASNFDSSLSCRYDVTPQYRNRLGADRLAAYIGALTLLPHKSFLIIDAGTAMTADVVDSKGKFCGGNISLGIRSRLKALNEYTAHLPHVEPEGPLTLFGSDTVTAMRDGAVGGALGEVLYDYDNAKRRYEASAIILTGGDAHLLMPHLEKTGIELLHDPYLVSRGLNAHFRHLL